MFLKYSSVIFLLFVSLQVRAESPSFFRKCSKTDPNLNQCILASAKEVIPQLYEGNEILNIPRVVPYFLPHAEHISENLKFFADNVTINGLDTLEMTKVGASFGDKYTSHFYHIKHLDVTGQYKIDGKVINFPINGEGKFEFSFDDIRLGFGYYLDYDLTKEVIPINIVSKDWKWDVDTSKYQFYNLFNGDQALGDRMNVILNDNTIEADRRIGVVVFEAIKDIFDNIGEKLGKTHTLNDIYY